MSDIILGIDLGTTFSAAAYIDESTGRPQAIKTVDERSSIPSVVQIENGRAKAVGELALNQWKVDEEHVVRWIKRAMGDPDFRFQGLSAVEISAEILKSLKESAESSLGESISKAVITCPAYFAAKEIAATRDAGILAGFDVLEIIKEPTAAAVYYGVDHMEDDETILVCDLGGGTYDATILHHKDGVFSPLATSGDRMMGGHDWTSDLFDMVKSRFYQDTGIDLDTDLSATQLLYEACEEGKKMFSKLGEVSIPCASGGKTSSIAITRDEFEEETDWRMQHLVDVTRQCLSKAGVDWGDIDRILLVGGSCRLRAMARVLAEASGTTPEQSKDPDLSVAFGAAICASGKVRSRKKGGLAERKGPILMEPVIKRIIARSLGTRVIIVEGGKPRVGNALLIPHSTEVPEEGLEVSRDDFEVSRAGQAHIDVPVVEFEDDDDYEVLGNFRFTCPQGSRKGDRVRISFRYDKNTIATVSASSVASGAPLASQEVAYEEPDADALETVQPRWVVFVIDLSFSMDGANKLENARNAIRDNSRKLLERGPGCEVAVVGFASEASVVCHPTGDLSAVERSVHAMVTTGSTAMDKGILKAIELARRAPSGTAVDLVLLTDGQPDDREETLSAARRITMDGGGSITLATLGVGHQDVDQDFLNQLSPLSLVIDKTGDFSGSMQTLLTQSAANRSAGKLREV